MEYRVEEALKKYVIDSEATIVYLQICRNVTSSSLDEKLTPDERVYRICQIRFGTVYFFCVFEKLSFQNLRYIV